MKDFSLNFKYLKIMAIRTNYKFEEFYNLIKNKINEDNENAPTFWGNGSIARALSRSVAYFNELLQLQVNIVFSSFRLALARGLHLRNRVGDFGISANAATNAIAIQAFAGTTGRITDYTVPQNTVVSTDTDIFGNNITYTLNGSVTLSSGAIMVTGLVTCTQAGTIGNVASGKINKLQANLVGIASTYNVQDVSNGAEDESDKDLRSRVPSTIKGLAKANEEAIIAEIYKVPEVSFVKITENHPTNGNFSIFVTTENGVIDDITRERVSQAARKVKSFTITYSIITPIISGIVVSLDVEIDLENYQQSTMKNLIQITLQDFVNNKKISALTISDINFVIRKINGVLNVKNILINSIAADVVLEDIYTIKIADVANVTVNFL